MGEVMSHIPLWGSGWTGTIGVGRVLVNSWECYMPVNHASSFLWSAMLLFSLTKTLFQSGTLSVRNMPWSSSTWDWWFSVAWSDDALVFLCPHRGDGMWLIREGKLKSFVCWSVVDDIPAVVYRCSLFLISMIKTCFNAHNFPFSISAFYLYF